MEEPVEEADSRRLLGQELAPLVEGLVAGDPERDALLGSGATSRKNSWVPVSSIGAKAISSIMMRSLRRRCSRTWSAELLERHRYAVSTSSGAWK